MSPATGPGSGAVTFQELAGALIAQFEGCKLNAYLDSGGVWTIGYGHTGPDVLPTSTITEQEALDLLAKDQAALFAMVADVPSIPAKAAYISFGFNCGKAALAKVLQGHALMSQFVHDHLGNTLPGLVSRRRLEELLTLL